jgi:hypothetical protein
LEFVGARDFGAAPKLAHQRDFRTTGKCHVLFYDIIAEIIAAQRFLTLVLLVLARKCHEMYGCVTFYDICEGCF